MCSDMQWELFAAVLPLVTSFGSKRILPSVDAIVFLQIATLGEALATCLAGEWLLSGVDEVVLL